jgi:N-acetylglucosaminyldiphosphoundecaprenol N-acetyl-beta-D-mannosaminyltransferase
LDIPCAATNLDAVIAHILHSITTASASFETRTISAISIHTLVYARASRQAITALRHAYMNLLDGTPAVWLARMKGARTARKCRGPTLMRRLLEASATQPVRHAFCGGPPGVADMLRARVAQQLGNTQVVYTYTPPFRPMTDAEIADLAAALDRHEVDIVWIGISSPKQEILAYRLAQYTRRVRYIITVGGAFDMLSGLVPEAPVWMQRMALEWLFRLLVEPRRLWKRYTTVIPKFLFLAARDLWKFLRAKGRGQSCL